MIGIDLKETIKATFRAPELNLNLNVEEQYDDDYNLSLDWNEDCDQNIFVESISTLSLYAKMKALNSFSKVIMETLEHRNLGLMIEEFENEWDEDENERFIDLVMKDLIKKLGTANKGKKK